MPFLRRNLGLVFQDQKLLFDRSVFDNVMLPLHDRRLARRARRRGACAPRSTRSACSGARRRMPITLSGGEQQRLCIARAVVNRPAILLADEPTGNLDAPTRPQSHGDLPRVQPGRRDGA